LSNLKQFLDTFSIEKIIEIFFLNMWLYLSTNAQKIFTRKISIIWKHLTSKTFIRI
jgi:hypothetical protein